MHTNLACKYSCKLRLTWNPIWNLLLVAWRLGQDLFTSGFFWGIFGIQHWVVIPAFGYCFRRQLPIAKKSPRARIFPSGMTNMCPVYVQLHIPLCKKKSTDELILFLLQRAVKRWKWKTGHISKNYTIWKIGHSAKLKIVDFQKCEMSSSPIWKSMCSLACCIFC